MAGHLKGGQYAVTSTPTNITSALSIASAFPCKSITVKNAQGAVNLLYAGGSTVSNTPANAHVELDANQGYTWYSGEGWLFSTDDIFLVGTANAANIAFIELVS